MKKRGIQPGYIRALELALAYLFQHNVENETLVNDKLAQGGASSLLLSRDSKESNKLHKRWRKARFHTDIDRLLSGGGSTRHEPSESSSSDSDDDASNMEGPSSVAPKHGLTQNLHVPSEPETSTRQHVTTSTRLEIPQDSWRLLETYFTCTCWFPVSEKHDLMKLSYSYPAEGLKLSSESPDVGLHAELWSVLALASVHDGNVSNSAAMTARRLYATARSLIPDESGHFDLNHVKALLNLAIFNIAHALMDAAWLIVAFASRILQSRDQSILAINSRSKHAFHGCFILDSMLALYFDCRPCLRIQDVKAKGVIDENGLEEWQPWNTGSRPSSIQQSRIPALALSTFNGLLDIVSLLTEDDVPAQNRLERLKAWENSLPPKLAHICAATPPTCLSPPMTLLRLTYFCAALALTPSQTWLLRALNLVEQAQDEIGWKSLPPVLRCLLGYVENRSATLSSSHEIRSRLESLRGAMNTAWPPMLSQQGKHAATFHTQPADAAQVATPTSISRPVDLILSGGNTHTTHLPFDAAMAGRQSFVDSTTHAEGVQEASISGPGEPQYQELPSDLESFFDELAALDNTNDSDTQFMQNLGFAPDADMAELFSEYIPIQSSAFMPQEASNAMSLDDYGLYDGS